MANIVPPIPPSMAGSTAASTAGPSAAPALTLANPPQGLTQVAPGTAIQGTVVASETPGTLAIQTPVGTLNVPSTLTLPNNAVLSLLLQSLTPQARLLITAINGQPPGQILQSQPGNTPTASTPGAPGGQRRHYLRYRFLSAPRPSLPLLSCPNLHLTDSPAPPYKQTHRTRRKVPRQQQCKEQAAQRRRSARWHNWQNRRPERLVYRIQLGDQPPHHLGHPHPRRPQAPPAKHQIYCRPLIKPAPKYRYASPTFNRRHPEWHRHYLRYHRLHFRSGKSSQVFSPAQHRRDWRPCKHRRDNCHSPSRRHRKAQSSLLKLPVGH